MPTYYVEDYDGDRDGDAVDPAPADTDASPVEDVTAKVVEAESDPKTARKTSKAQTK